MRLDLVHLLRTLRRSRSSAAAAIVTLSLTLGASASIFAVVDAVLLTPPPFTDPESLVIVGETPIDDPAAAPRPVSYTTFEAWRHRTGSLATLEAIDGTNLTLTGFGAAERLSGTYVTPELLPLLGVTPALGRGFTSDDLGQRVAIVSHDFWHGRLAADPGAIGREIVLGGRPYTIVGVLPERFFFALNPSDFWIPMPATSASARAAQRVSGIARLGRNIPPASLEAALDDVSRTSSPPAHASSRRLAAAIIGDARRTLGLLAGAAAIAVLIAFTNLAGLLIVRSIDRRREMAVRSALGARRSEIARLSLLEAEALVAVGIAGGVLLALWLTPVVGRLALQQFGGIANREIAVSWRVIAAMSIVAAICAWICGSLPALVAARGNVVDVLRRGATPRPRELTMRRAFVTGQVALAFVLVVSVTLLGRSLVTLLRVNPGFDPRGVLALSVSVPAANYPSLERVVSFYSALQSELEERLGSRAVSIINELPLTHDRGRSLVSLRQTDVGREAVVREAGTAYFDVMRIPVLAGRPFDTTDNLSASTRVVLSEQVATRVFGAEQPIGRQIWLAAAGQMADVIGVVGEVKHRALDAPASPTVYLSAWQSVSRSRLIVVRSARPDADVIAAVREAVGRLDPSLPVYSTRPMAAVVEASPGVPARRVLTAAFLGFALLAIVLGAIGLFGVVAHDVARRRVELAIRLALGADPMRIMRATLGQAAMLLAAGLVGGALLSLWTARTLGSLVIGGNHIDLVSVSVATAVLVLVGGAAVVPVARRAARTDPLIALRSE
jgi:putative ABC transport system permease protein